MNSHLLKRLVIVIGYILLFSAIGWLIHFLITPKESCFDGKKNQSETEVDCGGVCSPCKVTYVGKDLVVGEKTFVSGGNNTYDALVRISNPNDSIGVSSFHYKITLEDSAGAALSAKEGDDYILPADSKYIAQLGLSIANNAIPVQIDFAISDVKWSQLTNIEKPQLNVYNKKFGPDTNGVGNRAEGLIRNESANDFKKISVVVVLRDEKNNVLGVNTTQKDNIRARQESDFILTWPYNFPAPVRGMEVDTQTNVFDSQNFSAGM